MKKFYKILLGLAFALTILITTGVTSASAESDDRAYEYNGVTFYYTIDGSSCYVIGADNAIGLVEIPRIMDVYYVTGIGDGAFKKNVNITSVIIPENVVSIGSNAFNGCANLRNVVLPNSLYTIGPGAFANTALTKVYIPDSVKIIGATAFRGTGIEGLDSDLSTVTPTPQPSTKPTVTPTTTPVVNDKSDVVVVTVSGLNNPTKIYKGDSFGLKGTVKAEDGVDTITAYILNADNKAVIKVTDTISKGSYNINKGKINKDVIFGKLGIGKYTYRLTVSGKNVEEQVILNATFEVVKAASKPVTNTPTPTPKPTKAPEPENEVLEVNTISASVPLNISVNVDPASEYLMLTSDVSISTLRDSCPVIVSIMNSHSEDSSKILVSGEDELPGGKTWEDLSKRYAKKYFSIGLSPQRGWDSTFSRDAAYLGASTITGLGVLDSGETGSILVEHECSSNLEEVVDFNINLGIFIKSDRDTDSRN